MSSRPWIQPLVMGSLLLILSGCGTLGQKPVTVVTPTPGVSSVPTNPADMERKRRLQQCEDDRKAFSQRLNQRQAMSARDAAYSLFSNDICRPVQLYIPVWSMLDISRDPDFIEDFLSHVQQSSLARDNSPQAQVTQDYLATIEDYLTQGQAGSAEAKLNDVDRQLQAGVFKELPPLDALAKDQVRFLRGVIADLKKEEVGYNACTAYWSQYDNWTPQELKTGLYYQLASHIQATLKTIWTGLGEMRHPHAEAAKGSVEDQFQQVPVSSKLFEARVQLDELNYVFSKPDYAPIVESFQIELMPEFALKGVNDIIEAFYTQQGEYKGQFQSGIAYLNRAQSLVAPLMNDVRQRIASSRHPGCADQFQLRNRKVAETQ